MIEFTIKPVKSKPVKKITRARKGASKTKDIKTCYDCPECTLTGETVEGLKKYRCGFNPMVTKLLPKIMSECSQMNKRKLQVTMSADYVQQAYKDVRRWHKK